MTRATSIIALIAWLGVTFAVIYLGNIWTETGEGSWYQRLDRPGFTPPGWVFGPAWAINCVLMGTSAWLVWRRFGFTRAPLALGLFLAQLATAGLFTPIFFGARSTLGGMIVMLVLLALVIGTILAFWRRHAPAGALLLPYLAWVGLATAVAIGIWRMN